MDHEANRLTRNKMQADKELQEALDKIIIKAVYELTEHDKQFLRARSSYLTGIQKEKFASVLEEPKKTVKKVK